MKRDLVEMPPDVAAELDRLAARYRAANGPAMQLLGIVGGQAENLLERLPDRVKDGLEEATRVALERALVLAGESRRNVADQPDWLNRLVTTALGAAGGVAGLPGALAEVPVTVTLLLRNIQGIAADHGFDPDAPDTRADCVSVFAAAGPLARDDGMNTGFLAARATITGPALRALVARVAPRLATVIGQKLGAQTVPVLGAVGGAVVNYAFTAYYQEVARVHFGLRRLADTGRMDPDALAEALRARLERRPRA